MAALAYRAAGWLPAAGSALLIGLAMLIGFAFHGWTARAGMLDGPPEPEPLAAPAPGGAASTPRSAPATKPEAVLPQPMPVLRRFDDLEPFSTDGDSSNRFAFDPDSIRVKSPFVMLTIAVRSPAGATTIGYHAIDCATAQQRLLALADTSGQWQVADSRSPWRLIMNGDTRNRQYHAIFAGVCRVGKKPADSVGEMVRTIREGRRYSGSDRRRRSSHQPSCEWRRSMSQRPAILLMCPLFEGTRTGARPTLPVPPTLAGRRSCGTDCRPRRSCRGGGQHVGRTSRSRHSSKGCRA